MMKRICNCGQEHDGPCGDNLFAEDGDLAPAIVSLTKHCEAGGLSSVEIVLQYQEKLTQIEDWCEAQEALIGHLKLTLSAGDKVLMLSCTGSGVQQLGEVEFLCGDKAYELTFAGIVYGVDRQEFETLFREII